MNIKALALGGAFAATMAFASPAFAVVCASTDITPNAMLCSGGYTGNALSNSPAHIAEQIVGLAAIGFTWDGTNWNDFEKIDFSGTDINFDTVMNGVTYVGIHSGGGKGGGTTQYYKFDAGDALDILKWNLCCGSDAVLYGTEDGGGGIGQGVPEPASWALMLGGFGMIGSVMRSRKAVRVEFAE